MMHRPLPTGKVAVRMLFEADGNKPRTGAKVTLWAGDRQIREGTMPHDHALHEHASINAVANGVAA